MSAIDEVSVASGWSSIKSPDYYAPGGGSIAAESDATALELFGKGEEGLKMSPTEYRQCMVVFIVMGSAALYFWNSVLNTLYTVVVTRYPDHLSLADTVTASYSTVAFLTAFGLSWIGAARVQWNVIGGTVLAIMTLIFPVAAVYVDGTTGYVMLVVIAVIAGFAEMLFQVSGFAFAVILPQAFGGWVSFGYGICGVITFFVWTTLSYGLKITDENGAPTDKIPLAVWIHFTIAAVFILISMGSFLWLYKQPVMQDAVARAKDVYSKSGANLITHQNREDLSIWQVFKQTWKMQSGLAFLIGLSMMAYPNIGPYQWRQSIRRNDILTVISRRFCRHHLFCRGASNLEISRDDTFLIFLSLSLSF